MYESFCKFKSRLIHYKSFEGIYYEVVKFKGKAILSGYYNEIYLPLEQAGWQRIDFPTVCHAAGKTRQTKILGEGTAKEKQPRIESIWISPNAIKN